jgi:hypothetical protein
MQSTGQHTSAQHRSARAKTKEGSHRLAHSPSLLTFDSVWCIMNLENKKKQDAMDMIPTIHVSPEALLQRIDTIIRELQELRQLVVVQPQHQTEPHKPDPVTQLAGCLGQGSWDEYEDDVEWERFAS